jgi:DNA-binding CsgD family transcriptional regulator
MIQARWKALFVSYVRLSGTESRCFEWHQGQTRRRPGDETGGDIVTKLAAIGDELRNAGDEPVRLAPRQREILALGAEGATDNEIACRLCLSSPSVPQYAKRLRQRLGASSHAHAVALALTLGLLDTDPTGHLGT